VSAREGKGRRARVLFFLLFTWGRRIGGGGRGRGVLPSAFGAFGALFVVRVYVGVMSGLPSLSCTTRTVLGDVLAVVIVVVVVLLAGRHRRRAGARHGPRIARARASSAAKAIRHRGSCAS
jgi:hypothetical protein